MMKINWACIGIALAMMMANLVAQGWCQQDQDSSSSSSCLNQLAPCLNYLNGISRGDVPDSCCDPLKTVLKSRPECLCSMISNKGSREAERAGINVTEAQELPGRCGQHVNPLACLNSGTSPNSRNSADDQDSAGLLLLPSHTTLFTIAISICMSTSLW